MENGQTCAIPQPRSERERLRALIRMFINARSFVPPLSMPHLLLLAGELTRENGLDEAWKGWLMVEINNGVWRETVASVPYDKRMLLLPQCLRHSAACQAETDAFGLLCRQCGRCPVPTLQDKADALGSMSLVAEGFTAVVGLVESGAVQAVIGVGCLESLEKAFPLLINSAIPGIAVPLNVAGCKDTEVDTSCVSDFLEMLSEDLSKQPMDYEQLKAEVTEWFLPGNRPELFRGARDPASLIAGEWLSGDGKRWRPYLLAALYAAITGETEIPEHVKRAALAVECFHKASLVHDDIQDNDTWRHGRQTVHAVQGIPVAINVGDMLLGEGYRLLSLCGNAELIRTASEAHVALCRGQGAELAWCRSPQELTLAFVLDIFEKKTVPAFEVALIFGAICAGANEPLRTTLHEYARALGIAYQLQDDLADFENDAPLLLRPSAVLAALCEHSRDYVGRLRPDDDMKPFLRQEREALAHALATVGALAGEYHRRAIAALDGLRNAEIKQLLFRVTERILH